MTTETDDTARLSFALGVNGSISAYIKFADAKAGAVLSLATLVGGVIAFSAKAMLEPSGSVAPGAVVVGFVVFGTAAVSVLLALWQAVDALSPRTATAKDSLASFPDVAKLPPAQYVALVGALSTASALTQLSQHNHALALIAARKYEAIKGSLLALRVSLVAAYLSALLYAAATYHT